MLTMFVQVSAKIGLSKMKATDDGTRSRIEVLSGNGPDPLFSNWRIFWEDMSGDTSRRIAVFVASLATYNQRK